MNMTVKIGRLELKNPVMAASGTFGVEYEELVGINMLAAIVLKTVTLKPRSGNPPPRLVETPCGLLNSIGLENAGLEKFIKEKLPRAKKFKIPVIASISGDTAEEFVKMAARLDKADVDAIELNLSCPNICRDRSPNGPIIKRRGQGPRPTSDSNPQLIAQNPKVTYEVLKAVRKATNLTLITKLTPNVTDITEIARAAEEAGSDAVSLVNTFMGMAVDIETSRPKLGAVTGGLSGPAIKPMALKMVWDTFNKVKIPIIGIGGIMDYKDALEFIICGAAAVQVGTANFVNPKATIEIVGGIKKYLQDNRIEDVKELRGSLII